MSPGAFEKWLDRLGYSAEPALLHRRGEDIPDAHPYALEIKTLLKPEGAIRARAVFEVEGVPTVVFVSEDDAPLSTAALDEARKKIWNQNLATVVIEVRARRRDGQSLAARSEMVRREGTCRP